MSAKSFANQLKSKGFSIVESGPGYAIVLLGHNGAMMEPRQILNFPDIPVPSSVGVQRTQKGLRIYDL